MGPIEAGDTDRIMDSEPEWRKQTDLVSQNMLSLKNTNHRPGLLSSTRDQSFDVNSILDESY